MSEKTGIAWTDATINFWHGCHKVSEGCKFCYMYRDKARWKEDGNVVLKTQPGTVNSTLTKLHKLREEMIAAGNHTRLKIFTCSWSDFFIEEADPWREEAWAVIRDNPEFDWQVLTKRIERVKDLLPPDWGEGWNHVWIGVSAENQKRWDERVPLLLNTPAKIRFVSAEPLLGPIDGSIHFKKFFFSGKTWEKVDWVIVGGESGNDHGPWRYRPAHLEWFHDLVKECKEAKVPVFVKQLGTHIAKQLVKSRAGDIMEEWPSMLENLKIREFPKTPYAVHI